MTGGVLVVLVTASQTWDDPDPIHTVLDLYLRYAFSRGLVLEVLHGDCPRGGDAIARRFVERYQPKGWPIRQERVPADWNGPCRDSCRPQPGGGSHRRVSAKYGGEFCPAAGIYRSFDMCERMPYACEAFIRDASPGATSCADYADKLGIPTQRTFWELRGEPRLAIAGGITL